MKARTQGKRRHLYESNRLDARGMDGRQGSFSRISLHERKEGSRSLFLSFSLSFIRLNIPRNIYLPAGYIASFFARSPFLPSLSLTETHGHARFIRGVVITGRRRDSVLLATSPLPIPPPLWIRALPIDTIAT